MLNGMKQIGTVTFVQVQPESLKGVTGKVYDPAPLRVVESLLLTSDGIIGVTDADEQIVDVHNKTHPRSRDTGINQFSFGLTSHYDAIRDRYGDHIADGSGGENIIIECGQAMNLTTLGDKIAFVNPSEGKTIIMRMEKIVAPCTPFSQYVTQNPNLDGQALKETLQFLHDGQRGFMATPEHFDEVLRIQEGDHFYISG